MDKFFFFVFIVVMVGYLWADNHNQKQKKIFHNKINNYQDKAKHGDLNAQKELAWLYAHGVDLYFSKTYGVNLQNSAYWYEQSAMQGDVNSQFIIADIYENGIAIDVNLQNANYWYYQASLQGDNLSQYRLAQNFENGKGIPKS